ncbi:hypothetical protein NIES4071_17180 [Calothrix sp. NIES-4071]|nr:hypothetical protein NIES4071_17180 [Calothrix sp. NIES-4071]BAZ56051.1 hypothetical protein NIES4105_17130 [Calothrix sp. NIES-4105]
MIVFIDSGVLGVLATPIKSDEASICEQWVYGLLAKGVDVCSSQLCDYEVRRSMVLEARKNPHSDNISSSDELQDMINFLPVTSEVLIQAAELWASARSQGTPTGDNKSLDDMIICDYWQMLREESRGRYIVIATNNVEYLGRFAESQLWINIKF